MTIYFKILAQIQSRADYDKILRTALSKPGPEAFHYFNAFPFDKKEAPLLLVGDIGKPLLADLKKAAPKATYATGTCSVNTKDEILIERTGGKLQLKELTAGLRLAGIKNVVKLAGDDEDEGGEGQGQEPPPSTSTPVAKTTKPGVPTQEQLAKANLKPTPQQNKPVAPQDPAVAKQWQEKMKVLKPLFEQTLKKAKAQAGSSWAEDLEGAYDQMVHEAKGGDFNAAMTSLGRLARMLKSEEAARAEAKHQTMRENPDIREATAQSTRELYGKEADKERRKETKASGYNLTDDGNVMYAQAYTAQEWKAAVIDPLTAVKILLEQGEPDVERFEKALARAAVMVARASTHFHESDGRYPERREPIVAIEEAMRDLQLESSKLLMKKLNGKTAKQIAEQCDKLKKAVLEHVHEKAPPGRRNQQQMLAFAREEGDRKERRRHRLEEIIQQIKDKEREQDHLEGLVLSNKLPEHHPRARELQEVKQELEGLKLILRTTSGKFDPEAGEREMRRLYEANVQDPEKVLTVLDQLEQIKDRVASGAYEPALQLAYGLRNTLGLDGTEEGKELELFYDVDALPADIQLLRDTTQASTKVIVGLAADAKKAAEGLHKVLG